MTDKSRTGRYDSSGIRMTRHLTLPASDTDNSGIQPKGKNILISDRFGKIPFIRNNISADANYVFVDNDWEIYNRFADTFRKHGYNLIVFDKNRSSRNSCDSDCTDNLCNYNPFRYIYRGDRKAIAAFAKVMSDNLIPGLYEDKESCKLHKDIAEYIYRLLVTYMTDEYDDSHKKTLHYLAKLALTYNSNRFSNAPDMPNFDKEIHKLLTDKPDSETAKLYKDVEELDSELIDKTVRYSIGQQLYNTWIIPKDDDELHLDSFIEGKNILFIEAESDWHDRFYAPLIIHQLYDEIIKARNTHNNSEMRSVRFFLCDDRYWSNKIYPSAGYYTNLCRMMMEAPENNMSFFLFTWDIQELESQYGIQYKSIISLCDAILFTSADIYMELQDNCDINDMIFIVRKSTGQPSYRYSSISKYWKESDVAISENPDRPETVKIHVKNPEQVVYLPDNGLYIDRPLKRW